MKCITLLSDNGPDLASDTTEEIFPSKQHSSKLLWPYLSYRWIPWTVISLRVLSVSYAEKVMSKDKL